PREPSHGDSRWATVRYALSSNARTARLCLILLVMTGVPGVLLAVVLHHVRLRRAGPVLGVLMPTHGGTRCCHFAEPARPPAGLVRQRGDLDRLRARADAGDKTAGRLADLLQDCGDLDEVAQALCTAADAGDLVTGRELVTLLYRRGDLE